MRLAVSIPAIIGLLFSTFAWGDTLRLSIPATLSAGTHQMTVTNANGDSNAMGFTVEQAGNDSSQVYQELHDKAQVIYSGDGRWSKGYPYRNMLRDSAWKADVYAAHNPAIANAIGDYLASVQAQAGSGVYPIPADNRHPEFGKDIAQAMKNCPACVRNGWLHDLPLSPEPSFHQLYFDHGSGLNATAHIARMLGRSDLLPSVRQGADWAIMAIGKQVSSNTNYNSFLALGLSEAYRATNDTRYRDTAVDIQVKHVVPLQHATGRFGDAHNQEPVYHGIITQALINTAIIAPAGLLPAVEKAAGAMRSIANTVSCRQVDAWPGTHLRAWHLLREIRALTAAEEAIVAKLQDCVSFHLRSSISTPGTYRYQKVLYSLFSGGLGGGNGGPPPPPPPDEAPVISGISPAAGTPGVSVTITGTGFTPTGNTVKAGEKIIGTVDSGDGNGGNGGGNGMNGSFGALGAFGTFED